MIKRKTKNLITTTLFAFIFLLSVLALLSGCFLSNKYEIAGRVLVDGTPVKGVTVSCEKTETTTNKNGKYRLTGLQGEVNVKFSSDEYWFPDETYRFTKKAVCDSTNGKKYRTVSGVCVNGTEKIAGVRVELTDDLKKLVTFTDSKGEFSVSKLVGDVKIEATDGEKKLYSKTSLYNKGENDRVEIVSYSTFTLGFTLADGLTLADFSAIYDGEEYQVSANRTLELTSAEYGAEIELISDEFGFSENPVIISEENEIKTVTVYKKYTVNGVVNCGNEAIEDAGVYSDGNLVATTDADGKFTVEGLFGENKLLIKKDGNAEEEISANKDNTDFTVNLKKYVTGVVTTDELKAEGLAIKLVPCNGETEPQIVKTDKNGRYKILAENGDTIEVYDENIYFEKTGTLIKGDLFTVDFSGERYYDLKIKLVKDDEAEFAAYITDDKNISVDLVGATGENAVKFETINGEYTAKSEKLHGEKTVTFVKDGYAVEITAGYPSEKTEEKSIKISYLLNNIVINIKKIYKISPVIKSGETVIENAKLFVNGIEIVPNENKAFDFTLKKGDELTVTAGGYDDYKKTFDGNAEDLSEINLFYGVKVKVLCGTKALKNYELKVNGETYSYKTDGEDAVVSGLNGENKIEIIKDGYVLDISDSGSDCVTVNKSATINATSEYFVVIKVSVGKVAAVNAKVILFDNATGEKTEAFTGDDGTVKFENLTSEYTVITEDVDGVRFKPDYFTIEEGGRFTFADSGYLITIKAAVGDTVLPGVKISYGGKTVTTGESGEYKISLSEETQVVIEKEGYEFDKNILDVTSDDDGKTILLSATYTVKGKITSGETNLGGVTVTAGEKTTVTGENGEYVLSGIDKMNETISFKKVGFVTEEKIVAGYTALSASLYADLKFDVRCGEDTVEDTILKANGTEADKFYLGDEIEIVKKGYEFGLLKITEELLGTTVKVNGSYFIEGTVLSGTIAVCKAKITVNGEEKTVTDETGAFTVKGLTGKSVIAVVKDGYETEDITVNVPITLKIQTTYGIKVVIASGGIPVENAEIKVGGVRKAITDETGTAYIKGLKGEAIIEPELNGYEFTGKTNITAPEDLTFTATYSASGSVLIGTDGQAVKKAKIKLNGSDGGYTDDKGKFELKGLSGTTEILFEKDGYEIETLKLTKPYAENVKAKFFVNITFDGDITNAYAIINDTENLVTDTDLSYGPFDTAVKISFNKDGYVFEPEKIEARDYTVKTISILKAFTVKGKITTSSGIPVIGIMVSGGNRTTETASDGSYVLTGLTGGAQIGAKYSFVVNGANVYEHDSAVSGTEVYVTDTDNVNFTISDEAYAWSLYEYNYLVKLGSYGDVAYKIKGTGDVTATAGVKTYGGFIKIKDNSGNILTENSNYGNVVFGIDPRVSLLSYKKASGTNVTYTQINGDKVKGANNADYSSASFNDVSESSYTDKYGAGADGILIYNIDDTTVDSISLSGSSSGTTISMNLKTTDKMFAAYKKQIKEMSNVSMESFSYVRLYFTINLSGMVTHVKVEEKYTVKTMNATSSAVLNYDYTYTGIQDLSGFKKDNSTVQKLLGR